MILKIVRTNNNKVKIDNIQKNSNFKLCGDRDETVNSIISKDSKLAHNEYKTRHDWMGKVIYKELCKKLKLDHADT